MKKYCIFDLDGTLIDSMDEWARSMITILESEGIEYPDNIINILTPLGNEGGAKLFMQMGVSGTKEELIKRMQDYAYEAYSSRIVTKKGVTEALKKLKEDGHVLVVLTASPHITCDACLKNNKIYDIFDKVFTIEDFGTSKSDPEIYKMAAKKIGADISEITFFDDNLTALETAKSAGLEIYGVYDSSSDSTTEKIKEISSRYINSFEELL